MEMTERRMPRVVKAVTACSKMDNEILTYFRFILECGHAGASGKKHDKAKVTEHTSWED